MPKSAAFELFEDICHELTVRDTTIIPDDDVDAELIEDLKNCYEETEARAAFERAIAELTQHFGAKGSQLPFTFDGGTGEFRVADKDYIAFIAFAADKRGLKGEDARDFEVKTVQRLTTRLTGALHRVGWPRVEQSRKKDFVNYLKGLGFDDGCLERYDKDGGLDILWLPPLGSVPLRPVVSLQCKNAFFNMVDANASYGRAHTTLQRHSHIRGHGLYFVVFNDYIDETYLNRARGWPFVPLGLSDLGPTAGQPLETHLL